MTQPANNQLTAYHIRVRGILGSAITDWSGEVVILRQEHGETLLMGWFADQAALRGLLDHLWNLNFTILGIEQCGGSDDQEFDRT